MGSGRPLSDKGSILRESIGLVLREAKEPLTNQDLAESQLLAGLEFTPNDVSMTLVKMFNSTRRPFPLKRIRLHGRGAKWGYYNPEVVQVLEDKPRPKKTAAAEPPPPPAPPAPAEFRFDPIDLPRELAAQEPTVTVPPGVKSITIRIGGVSIQVELDGLAVVR
jgi:hypothetical protein